MCVLFSFSNEIVVGKIAKKYHVMLCGEVLHFVLGASCRRTVRAVRGVVYAVRGAVYANSSARTCVPSLLLCSLRVFCKYFHYLVLVVQESICIVNKRLRL